MSCTEIVGFNKKGDAYYYANVDNAWRGAMSIWKELEEKYLPPYIPEYIKCCKWYRQGMSVDTIAKKNGFKPTRTFALHDETAMKEIWELVDSKKTSFTDKVVLCTTFDWVIVKKEDMPMVIKAFNNFEGKTSLKEQAKILQTMVKDERCIAVAWNQTSVNCNTWVNYCYNDKTDESTPYNIFKNDKHWFLTTVEE